MQCAASDVGRDWVTDGSNDGTGILAGLRATLSSVGGYLSGLLGMGASESPASTIEDIWAAESIFDYEEHRQPVETDVWAADSIFDYEEHRQPVETDVWAADSIFDYEEHRQPIETDVWAADSIFDYEEHRIQSEDDVPLWEPEDIWDR